MFTVISVASSLLALTGIARSAEYHVALGGNDTAAGTSAAPWLTVQHGVDVLAAGDSLIVHAGTYVIDGKILVDGKTGTQAAPIAIQADGQVVLQDARTELPDWAGLFDVRNSSWVTIAGFRLEQPRFFGIFFQDCDHVTAEGNSTNESRASGVASWGSTNVTIRNNDVRAACNDGQMVPSKWGTDMGCQEGISLDTTVGFAVEGNVVHDAQQTGKAKWGGGEGIDVKNGSSNGVVTLNEVFNIVQLGIYVDAWENDISNVEIFRNHVHHNANGIIITSEQTGNVDGVKVHDNVVHDIGFAGVSVSHYDVAANVIANVQVFNNTVARIGYPENKPYFLPDQEKNATWGDGIVVGKPDVVSVVIRDNVIWDIGGGEPIAISAGLTGQTVEGNLTNDPLFTDYANRDLRVGAGSPVIDTGIGTRSPTELDYWGNLRVAGSKVDVGAFEYGSVPGAGGGAGAGGSAGAGGAAGSAGTGTGGAAGSAGTGTGGAAGSAGAGGAAGLGGAAGSGAPPATASAGEDDGCSCSAAGRDTTPQARWWFGALVGLLAGRRRKHGRAQALAAQGGGCPVPPLGIVVALAKKGRLVPLRTRTRDIVAGYLAHAVRRLGIGPSHE